MIDELKIARIANDLTRGLVDIVRDIDNKRNNEDEEFSWDECDEKFFDYINKELTKLEINGIKDIK